MKRTVVILCALCSSSLLVQAAPRISVVQAATMAEQELKDRGLSDRFYVTSLVMQRTAVTAPASFWFARWSDAIIGEGGSKEVGLKIKMDGAIARVVQSRASGESLANPSIYRGDRPSIVDLKR